MSSNIGAVRPLFLWWSVVECAGVRVLRVSEGEVINIHTMRRSEEECGGVRRNEVVV
jgi:hypothetical protein